MDLFHGLIQETIKITDNIQINKNYKIINFYEDFNQEISEFPQYLRYLCLGWYFNRKIKDFPQYLLYLHLGFEFCQKFNELSQYLLYLHLGLVFNQEIK